MRPDQHRYGKRTVTVGPSTVTKEVVQEDTCHPFIADYQHRSHWIMNMEGRINTEGLFKESPLHVDDYFVDYSLNKKRRWNIPEILRNDIEQFQDSLLNLRVSASIHSIDRTKSINTNQYNTLHHRNDPSVSYHDVSRDGKTVVNQYSKKGRARLFNLQHPKGLKPHDPKKDMYHRKKQKEEWFVEKQYLDVEEDQEYQKLHVQYFVNEFVNSSGLYNKTVKTNKKKGKRTNQRSATKDNNISNDTIDNSDEEWITNTEYEDIDHEYVHSTVSSDLSSFIVMKPPKIRMRRHRRRSRFCDESISTSFSIIDSDSEEIDDEDEVINEDTVIYEVPERIVLVTSQPQLFSTLPRGRLDHLQPVMEYPKTWSIHTKDTHNELNHHIPLCIIAKEREDGTILLFAVEECMECGDKWGKTEILRENVSSKDIQSITTEGYCSVCYREMSLSSVDQGQYPFGMDCGHVYCTSCWLQHISKSMKKKQLPTMCMDPSCTHSLSVPSASCLLDSVSLRAYSSILINVLLEQQKIVKCSDCSRLHHVNHKSPTVHCNCGTFICTLCSSVAHRPLSCRAFKEYSDYMKNNGLTTTHVSSADAPIINDLCRCPKCGELGENAYEWCRNVQCICGFEFCALCGQKWTNSHWDCDKKVITRATMIDVLQSNSVLNPTMLSLSIDARLSFFDKRKEVETKLQKVSIATRKQFMRTFNELYHIMEICYLNSRKSKRSYFIAKKIEFAMMYFFNTTDRNRRILLNKTSLLSQILDDITHELFL